MEDNACTGIGKGKKVRSELSTTSSPLSYELTSANLKYPVLNSPSPPSAPQLNLQLFPSIFFPSTLTKNVRHNPLRRKLHHRLHRRGQILARLPHLLHQHRQRRLPNARRQHRALSLHYRRPTLVVSGLDGRFGWRKGRCQVVEEYREGGEHAGGSL